MGAARRSFLQVTSKAAILSLTFHLLYGYPLGKAPGKRVEGDELSNVKRRPSLGNEPRVSMETKAEGSCQKNIGMYQPRQSFRALLGTDASQIITVFTTIIVIKSINAYGVSSQDHSEIINKRRIQDGELNVKVNKRRQPSVARQWLGSLFRRCSGASILR